MKYFVTRVGNPIKICDGGEQAVTSDPTFKRFFCSFQGRFALQYFRCDALIGSAA